MMVMVMMMSDMRCFFNSTLSFVAYLVFAFNFNPSTPFEGYWIHTPKTGKYQVVLSTDERQFGGFERIDKQYVYTAKKDTDGQAKFQIYLPARTALCLKKL